MQVFEFRAEEFRITVRLLIAPVVHQPIGLHLRRSQIPGDVQGDILEAERFDRHSDFFNRPFGLSNRARDSFLYDSTSWVSMKR